MGWTDRHGLKAACFITVAALIVFPILGKTQTALTPRQADEKAEALLGKKPDHVDSYFSKEENVQYFAFTFLTKGKWDEATKTENPWGGGDLDLRAGWGLQLHAAVLARAPTLA
jgi:hypothetical protein